jgi:phosphatidate cytidylyltransferase
LLQRVLTALIGIPVVLLVLWLGGAWFALAIMVFSVLAAMEFFRLAGLEPRDAWVFALAAGIPLYANLTFNLVPWLVFFLGFFLALISVCFVFRFSRSNLGEGAAIIFGSFYIPCLLASLVLIRQLDNGLVLVLMVLLITWGTDSGAYFVGTALGKRKFAPSISPNKSWAGFWGGTLVGLMIAMIYGIISGGNIYVIMLWGLITSVAGQIGDLAESAVKRYARVKDSGTFLPGHGGFFDRTDSLLFTGTVTYIFILLGLFA